MSKIAEPKRTILAFAAGTWRWPQVFGSPRYHLWTLAQRGWRVVYVEPPVRLRISSSHAAPPDAMHPAEFHIIAPGMMLPFAPRMVPNRALGEWWRQLTANRMAKGAKSFLSRMGWRVDAVWYGAPWHGAIAGHFADVASVYHVYDELAKSPALNSWQQQMLHDWEKDLMQSAHVTACSSLPQLEARRTVARRTLLLENAIPDDFGGKVSEGSRSGVLRASLSKLPRPLFLYGGVIDHRMDGALVKKLLSNERVGAVSFAGNLDRNTDNELKDLLQQHPKVHLLGRLSHEDYPVVYEQADALILLHKRNQFTETMYPEKLNEYLSSGKPILSIPLPEVVRIASQCELPGAVHFIHSAGDMDNAISACVDDRDAALSQARISVARKHIWSAMGAVLDDALGALL
ncbi:hypothetical protein IT571_05355 [Candidatus Sumerlaeota bacterium]|nr:hypothetical protein [Candidatus Sumerlaeota bacterium]